MLAILVARLGETSRLAQVWVLGLQWMRAGPLQLAWIADDAIVLGMR
jgi:hypothetical protein